MNTLTKLLWLILFATSLGFAQDTKPAAVPANPLFEKIKSLAGTTWEAKTAEGKIVTNEYRVISAGSAVLVDVHVAGEDEMLTVIHPDGAGVLATHYCTAKNQPRYTVTSGADPNVITFAFKDITNLSSPDAGHMHSGVMTILDADHMRQDWTWRQGGKDTSFGEVFTRKGASADAASATNSVFESMKSLAGDWEKKSHEGKPYRTNIKVISGGSALLMTENDEMITVVHPDGATLMATHYCGAKNQPRMVAVPGSDPKVIAFKFKDITNLSSSDAGHMTAVVFTLVDHDHYSEEWTFTDHGKDQVLKVELTRKN
jgi:hypothetical protein